MSADKTLDKAYEPALHDAKWQKFWEEEQIARPETVKKKHPRPSGETFSIVMPPPNVTGVLHQGHALMLALEDTLVRWRRMSGDETLYLPGTDHASIAVQMLVVKHLESQGKNVRQAGREAFIEQCWKWIEEYRPRIFGQIRRLGTSCDWSRVRFTMDPELNQAVLHAFVEFHRRGLIYRAERLVNWSPKGQTGLSDLEVLAQEREGSLWHIRYPVEGTNQVLIVATTRPETLLGDTAVAVHPDDERYQKLIGKNVVLPFTGRQVPIIGDAFVDRSFGSGAVKITPAHDHTDFEVGERHGLPKINVLTKEAKIVSGLPGEAAAFGGLDRFEARKEIVRLLEERGQLEKIEKHKLRLGVSERWGDVVEPYLSTQWYLKMDGMAAKATAAVTSQAQIKIIPHEFHNQFLRWMENIHDWCISRQLWWGQRIPAYHCQKCAHIEVAVEKPAQCPRCQSSSLEQDPDVLDTWFSSGLWPFSTMGWPDSSASDFQRFYPNSVMETGFDILFFWVARMVMMGLELTGKAPFSRVYLHPLVRDAEGQKMSKSKGNVLDPLELIADYGADTLRFTLNALCVQGRDLLLSTERLDGYKHFINKVWNATRFVLMGESAGLSALKRPQPQHLHDRWILGRLDAAARDVNAAWSEFRMQEAAETLYHFVWSDFCDWYLESAKVTRAESQATCLYVLSEMLKMLHPLCPHVTEELWHALPGVEARASLALADFPRGEAFPDTDALAEFRFLQDTVTALRNLRAEAKVPPGKKIRAYALNVGALSEKALGKNQALLLSLARLESLTLGQSPSGALTRVVVSGLEAGKTVELAVPLTELVNLEEEKTRLDKEVQSLTKLLAAQRGKLANENFVSRAPKEVIDKEKLKLSELSDKLEKTQATLKQLAGAGQ